MSIFKLHEIVSILSFQHLLQMEDFGPQVILLIASPAFIQRSFAIKLHL